MASPKTVQTVDLGHTTSAYFSPATVAGGSIHISGQVGTTKDGAFPEDYDSQIHLALINLKQVIFAAGASVTDIAKLTLYVVNYDPEKRKHVRHLQKFLKGHRPAITLVPVPQLAVRGYLFEVEAVVVRSPPSPTNLTPPTDTSSVKNVDVVIIGAGLAGLTAAEDVIRSGLSCVVLEARDRVGGKTWSHPLTKGDGVIDLGAAWINDTNQSRMFALAKRFGAELIEQNTSGNCVLQGFDGSCSTFPYGELPRVSIWRSFTVHRY